MVSRADPKRGEGTAALVALIRQRSLGRINARDLALACDVTEVTVSRWTHGTASPSPRVRAQLEWIAEQADAWWGQVLPVLLVPDIDSPGPRIAAAALSIAVVRAARTEKPTIVRYEVDAHNSTAPGAFFLSVAGPGRKHTALARDVDALRWCPRLRLTEPVGSFAFYARFKENHEPIT